MYVQSIMTPAPHTAGPDTTLDDVMQLMDEHRVRHVPIVDGETVVGVVSDRDLLGATGWQTVDKRAEGSPKLVSDILKGKPVVAGPDDTVVMTAVDLTSRGIGCLPVVEGGKLTGIVTEVDLLQAYLDLSKSDGCSANLHRPVSEHMMQAPATLEPNSTLGSAAQLELDQYVHHLPVLDNDKVVGIVSDRDIRKARGLGKSEDTKISEIMSADVRTLEPSAPLSRAAAELLEAHISALPVVEDGKLVGVFALVDILEHCVVNLRTPKA